jgi:hypothetical protein
MGSRARSGAPRVPARSTPGLALGGMAELARQRVASAQAASCRSQVRVLLPPLHDATSSNRQDDRLLPGGCWFEPSRRSSHAPVLRVGKPLVPHPTPSSGSSQNASRVASRPAKPASGGNRRRIARPDLLADRGCRPLTPATRVRIPLGVLRDPPCRGSVEDRGSASAFDRSVPEGRGRRPASPAGRPATPGSVH